MTYDFSKINIDKRCLTIACMKNRLVMDELSTEYQNIDAIESIIMRIPLPLIYLDATGDSNALYALTHNKLLHSILNFLEDGYKLKKLVFKDALNGLYMSELPRMYQRRILDTNLDICLIGTGTPPAYKMYIIDKVRNYAS